MPVACLLHHFSVTKVSKTTALACILTCAGWRANIKWRQTGRRRAVQFDLKCRASADANASADAGAALHVQPINSRGVLDDVLPLLRFSAQTLCIAVTDPILSLVDTSVVGRLSSDAQLAAMAPATAISGGLSYTLTFIPIAVTNLVALHMARKHPDAASALL